MPYKREMEKPDGLLTILRRAIMDNKQMVAANIARVCSQYRIIYFRKYCDFMLRILMEDKFPEGRKYIHALKESRDACYKGNTRDAKKKQITFASIAYTIAGLKTNHEPFEEAFVVLYEYVYLHDYMGREKVKSGIDMNALIDSEQFQEMKFENNQPKINKKRNKKIKYATLRNYKDDTLEINKQPREQDNSSEDCWSNDHVLREWYFDKCTSDSSSNANFEEQEYMEEEDLNKAWKSYKEKETIMKEYTTSLFTKRERTGKYKGLLQYFYPHATNETFKKYMKKYLNREGYTHYVGATKNNWVSLLQQLRYLARCKIERVKEINLHGKKYGLQYLSFSNYGWKVQLVAPKHVPKAPATQYTDLLDVYKLSYPVKWKEDETSLSYPRIGDHAQVYPTLTVRLNNNMYTFEKEEGQRMKFKRAHLQTNEQCLAFLQVLVYRYKHKYRTKLHDIVYKKELDPNTSSESFKMYSLNNNVDKKRNQHHYDIWHQLLYYQDPRIRGAHSSKSNSYMIKIINRLQQYLHDHGEYKGIFFNWLEQFHADYVKHIPSENCLVSEAPLWYRLIDTLDRTKRFYYMEKKQKKFFVREYNLTFYFIECPYIKDRLTRRDV